MTLAVRARFRTTEVGRAGRENPGGGGFGDLSSVCPYQAQA